MKESFARLFGDTPEAVVLHNVVDEAEILEKAHAFLPERPEVPTFAAVGRLSYEKGNDRLLEACRLLHTDGFDFRLWIIGEGPERDKLESLIREYNLEQCVKLWGFQTNPYPYMRGADLLLISADHGCDPGFTGTDHTREYVPLLAAGAAVRTDANLGTRVFSDLGATVLDIFGVTGNISGRSFAAEILRGQRDSL